MFNIENMLPIFGSHTIVSKEELNNKDNIIKQLTSELVGYKKAYESLTDSNSRLDARFNNLTKKYEAVCVENVSLSSEIKEANKNLGKAWKTKLRKRSKIIYKSLGEA